MLISWFCSLEEGEVFSWGSGYGGKLGQGHLRDRSTPVRVAALKEKKITNVACHEFHSAAVCGKSVVTWPRALRLVPIMITDDGRIAGIVDSLKHKINDCKQLCFHTIKKGQERYPQSLSL